MSSFLLTIALLGTPDLSRQAVAAKDYEAASFLLQFGRRSGITHTYLEAVTAFELGNQSVATRRCQELLDDFSGDVPRRYLVLAQLMLDDMKEWKKDLGDISRKMSGVGRRLALGKGGPQTQAQQKRILEDLDRLIKQAEDAQNGKDSAAAAQQEKGGKSDQASRPQDDSRPAQETGKGLVDEKKVRALAEVWGKLPPREQAQRMLELTRGLPPKYRDAVESYLRGLNTRTQYAK